MFFSRFCSFGKRGALKREDIFTSSSAPVHLLCASSLTQTELNHPTVLNVSDLLCTGTQMFNMTQMVQYVCVQDK